MEYSSKRDYQAFKRYCKTLLLEEDPRLIEECKRVHAPGAAWPEITLGMKEVGILDIEIYLTGNRLFMIMDTLPEFDHDKAMEELAAKPGQAEWEQYVARFLKSAEEASAG